ncbi:hypothetical protein HH308_02355 [Gordonia sp. TBRC 11910]|uniref:DUF35 domain-containing protein n=1 Tax=Gordonia asplenii TaxID=2725283 RepID=A0A848KP88_9ACTN|nr:OB-fold domain-containing protein [Gordonia asplenii]NMO00052.1 hypothetical protein [Gordonia asplenii]
MSETRVPVPKLDRTADSADFFDFAARGELLLRRCHTCGAIRGPQAALCSVCHSAAHDAIAAAGTGTLVSWSLVHRSPVPFIPAPYLAAIVELDEGPWVLTRLLTTTHRDSLHVGDPIVITVIDGVDGGENVVLARTEPENTRGRS